MMLGKEGTWSPRVVVVGIGDQEAWVNKRPRSERETRSGQQLQVGKTEQVPQEWRGGDRHEM